MQLKGQLSFIDTHGKEEQLQSGLESAEYSAGGHAFDPTAIQTCFLSLTHISTSIHQAMSET
jgi:hypothetical protein